MMAKPSECQGFKQLLEIWNKKLSDSGFQDIEYANHLGSGSGRRYEKLDPIVREAKLQYFKQVALYVSQTQFDNPLDRDILTLYAHGYTQVAIKRILGIQGHKCKIYYPLYKWLHEWGLK